VTARVREDVWNLRSRRSFRVIEAALSGVRNHEGFAVTHFSVQGNHIHLIVEAEGAAALASGMKAVAVRIARGLNKMMVRRGTVFSDRYHAHVLETPREVRNALAYVLLNFTSHRARSGCRERMFTAPDPYSSAATFDGWRDGRIPRSSGIAVTSPARTWMLTTGWRRHGLIGRDELPGPAPR
jgi:REP element-mobilizing transposase RayT